MFTAQSFNIKWRLKCCTAIGYLSLLVTWSGHMIKIFPTILMHWSVTDLTGKFQLGHLFLGALFSAHCIFFFFFWVFGSYFFFCRQTFGSNACDFRPVLFGFPSRFLPSIVVLWNFCWENFECWSLSRIILCLLQYLAGSFGGSIYYFYFYRWV